MDRLWNLQEKETTVFIREVKLLPRAKLSSAYMKFRREKINRLREYTTVLVDDIEPDQALVEFLEK